MDAYRMRSPGSGQERPPGLITATTKQGKNLRLCERLPRVLYPTEAKRWTKAPAFRFALWDLRPERAEGPTRKGFSLVVDTLSETLVTLTEACKFLPKRRKGKRPHPATIFSWASIGIRGIRLETIQCGGTKCTSREALQRFFDRLTAQSAGEPAPQPLPRARAADVRRAEKVLDAAGI